MAHSHMARTSFRGETINEPIGYAGANLIFEAAIDERPL